MGKKIKKFLKRNKIFAEIFSLIFLGIMGLIVSIAGYQINKRSSEIYQRQLEIMHNDREPYFTIKCEDIYEEVEETEETDKIAIKRYTIENKGGKIYDVSIEKFACAIIEMENEEGYIEDSNIFKLTFFDFFFYTDGHPPLYHPIQDGKDIVFYEYDLERKYDEDGYYNEDDFRYEDLFGDLQDELEKRFSCYINIRRKNFINITFTNYKNEKYKKRFQFEDNNIWISNEDEEGRDIGINCNENINEIADQVQDSIEELTKENEKLNNLNIEDGSSIGIDM